MDLPKYEEDIQVNISIPPHKFHIYEEYISEYLKKFENIPYNNKVGYIYSIININEIKPLKVNTNGFVGDLIFDVNFTASCYKPTIGSIIECKIIQNNNILFAKNGPLMIVVVEEENMNTKNFNIGDIIDIKIMCYEINKEYIKVVGRYIK